MPLGIMISNYNSKISMGKGILEQELIKLKEIPHVLITSETPATLLSEHLKGFKIVLVENNEQTYIEKLFVSKKIRKAKVIIALGSGTITDVAKVLAKIGNCRLISVPMILSSNVFATNKSVVREGGVVKTIESKVPDQVIVDFDVIKLAEPRYNLSGIADVLSTMTALYDWELAIKHNKEKDNPLIRNISYALLKTATTEYETLMKLDEEGILLLTESLLLSGYITNLFGSGRPESCSEHMFSRAVEEDNKYQKKMLHGESVMLGILLTSELQKQNNQIAYVIAKKMNLLFILKKIRFTEEEITKYFMKASRIRPERFSIFNTVNLDEEKARKIVKKVLRLLRE